ncbi:MAG TPA: triose-phosphate isomerase [Alphaproteobacteria bacterium]|nr:triose-phosphate isomerase [Alphaproteobacteria bacterium]HJN61499.1 triose-phosphate isomerase [Alphaproteobacteria bacterium]
MSQPSGGAAAPRPMVAANWKMNGLRRDGRDLARALARLKGAAGEPACDIVVCPPAALLFELRDDLLGAGMALGGQDCHAEAKGAHTGDISAELLGDCGCEYVILGHSERRANHGETSAMVSAKVAAAERAGLRAILCVGESEDERDVGRALAVVGEQLKESLAEAGASADITIAYEPVWAIGTGRTANAADIGEMHMHIRQLFGELKTGGESGLRVLYGGSVKAENAAEILSIAGVDGALVGGASLSAENFWRICAHYGQ